LATFVGDVQHSQAFCDAASIDGEQVADPTASMVCRKLRARGTSSLYPRRELSVRNRFGDQVLRLRKPTSICSPATTTADPPTASLPVYTCYRASPRTRFSRQDVLVADGFETVLTGVRRPAAICLPAEVEGNPVADPGDTVVCYTIRNDRSEPRFTPQMITATDLWQTRDLELKRVQTLCVPSYVDLP
jgi:hypothetical protein